MEILFPTAPGYKGLFLVGFRKDPVQPGTTQRIGTVILKRTYEINPEDGSLTPLAAAYPIFMQDQPDNLVKNSSFEEEIGNTWQPEGATIKTISDGDVHFLQVQGEPGGRVVQKITLDEPLCGREFTFSFSASANRTATKIEYVQLEAGGQIICSIRTPLENKMRRFAVSGRWPAHIKETQMSVVLRMATDRTRTVRYNNIQVEERAYDTLWNPRNIFRYEHDLAPFKPGCDLIVLGCAHRAGMWQVRVDNRIWYKRCIMPRNERPEKSLIGWEPRVGTHREKEAGTFSSNADDYPPQWPPASPARDPLPADFDNCFYNGFQRTFVVDKSVVTLPPFPYLGSRAKILIEREGKCEYTVILHGERTSAAYYYYVGNGPDDESSWQRKSFPMNADTLVIEPEKNRCYCVWRGVWPFDLHDEKAYRRMVIESLIE